MTARSWSLLALLATGCCFDAFAPTPPVAPAPIPPPMAPGSGTGPLLPGGGGVGGAGTPISFGIGTSEPTFAQGFAGGPMPGTSFDPSCYAGSYPVSPSHVLTIADSLPYVRVMAYSARGTDLTLLVRSPNGIVTCVDDADGLNPVVELSGVAPGEYQIYVGNYSSPSPEPYDLGVTTVSSTLPSTMHFAPPTLVATPTATTAPGTVLRTGSATVTSIRGSVPSVAAGSSCTFTQTRILSAGGPGVLDCQWHVTCAAVDLYGGSVPGGYQPCADATWSAGTLAMDSATTGTDNDPTLLYTGTSITIGDDASGPYGAFTVTLETTPTLGDIGAAS
ncbi:MAG: hypothetical protein U0234_16430 [Sandaracinus sp.]